MKNDLEIGQSYSDTMYIILADIKESMAIKRFKETTEVLGALGYSKEEIRDILNGVLKKIKCS